MRAITVKQPWAWAILHGGKDVENRSNVWRYRGPLAIHAGAKLSQRGMADGRIQTAMASPLNAPAGAWTTTGAVLGVVDLAGSHWSEPGCCDSQWAEVEYTEHGGRILSHVAHLVLANPRPIPLPIPATGHLGLWRLPVSVELELGYALAQAEDRRGAPEHDAGCPCAPDGPADSPPSMCACFGLGARP